MRKEDKNKSVTETEKSESNTLYTVSRLEFIRLRLQRGDKKIIAENLQVHPEWVSQVIRGKGVSEPVLAEAERIIKERWLENIPE